MDQNPAKTRSRRRWLIAGLLLAIVGMVGWFLQTAEQQRRQQIEHWRRVVGQGGVPIYPERPRNIPILKDIPGVNRLILRREIIVQVENDGDASALLSAPDPPVPLTILDAGISVDSLKRLASRFPDATVSTYPSLPQ